MGNSGSSIDPAQQSLLDAIARHDLKRMKAAVEEGASVKTEVAGRSALGQCIIQNFEEGVAYCLECGAQVTLGVITTIFAVDNKAALERFLPKLEARKDAQDALLLAAAQRNAASCIRHLVACGHDVNKEVELYGTVLGAAVIGGNPRATRALLAAGAELKGPSYQSLLAAAASNGEPRTLQCILDAGVDVDEVCASGETALHKAVRQGNGPAVVLLLRAGALCNVADNRGFYALNRSEEAICSVPLIQRGASYSGSIVAKVEAHRELLQGVNLVAHVGSYGVPDFGYTVPSGSPWTVDVALQIAVLIQRRILTGGRVVTPTGLDVEIGMAGAGQGSLPGCTRDAVVVAAIQNVYAGTSHDFLALVAESQEEEEEEEEEEVKDLVRAAALGEPRRMLRLIRQGADVDAKDGVGNSALHRACERNNGAAVAVLLKAGANPHVTDSAGWTALHRAESNRCIVPLMQVGVSATTTTKTEELEQLMQSWDLARHIRKYGDPQLGWTVPATAPWELDVALQIVDMVQEGVLTGGHIRTPTGLDVEISEEGAAMELPEDARDALCVGAVKEKFGKGELDVEALVVLAREQEENGTAAGRAVNLSAPVLADVVKDGEIVVPDKVRFETLKGLVLLDAAGELAECLGRWEGDTVEILGMATMCGSYKCIEVLLEAGADPQTAVIKAAACGKREAVEMLVEAGATLDGNEIGKTPLHYAASNGEPRAVGALIAMGMNVNAKDRGDSTPLHEACRKDNGPAVLALLKAGADPNVADMHGRLPLNGVKGNNRCIVPLMQAGSQVSGQPHTEVKEQLMQSWDLARHIKRYGDAELGWTVPVMAPWELDVALQIVDMVQEGVLTGGHIRTPTGLDVEISEEGAAMELPEDARDALCVGAVKEKFGKGELDVEALMVLAMEQEENGTAAARVPVRHEEVKEDGGGGGDEEGGGGERGKRGWLHKMDAISLNKGWKKRWFVLQDGVVSYYKHAEDTEPAGTIPVSSIVNVRVPFNLSKTHRKHNMIHALDVVVSGRTYELAAESEEERDEWLERISAEVF